MTGIPVMDLCNLWPLMTGRPIPGIPLTHIRTAIGVIVSWPDLRWPKRVSSPLEHAYLKPFLVCQGDLWA